MVVEAVAERLAGGLGVLFFEHVLTGLILPGATLAPVVGAPVAVPAPSRAAVATRTRRPFPDGDA